jgi:hypothetical protein
VYRATVSIIGLILFALSVSYIQNAVNAWYGNIFKPSGYQGLDVSAFLETKMSDDKLAIDWMNENIKGIPVILEANGDSYTDYNRISVFTGLPTVLGWRTHEWLWKSDTTLLDARAADIEKIYTSPDKAEILELLKNYKVSYLYVGKLEQEERERRAQEERERQQREAARLKDLNERVEQWRWAKVTSEFLDAVEADAVARGEAVGPGTPLGDWIAWGRERTAAVHEAATAARLGGPGAPVRL